MVIVPDVAPLNLESIGTDVVEDQVEAKNKVGGKRFKCEHCAFDTDIKGSLSRHIRTMHGQGPMHECEKCPYVTKRSDGLLVHQRTVHKMTPAPTNVPIKIENVRSMEEEPRGVIQHKCNHCSYVTTEGSNLKRHVKSVHDKIKDIKCDQCSFDTSDKGNLNRHKKFVHGVKWAPKKTKGKDNPESHISEKVQNIKQEVGEDDESEGQSG